MYKREINRIIGKFFKDSEINSEEKFYRFIDRKKIMVFVPVEYAGKVAEEMSRAGAGIIGNYEMCSFRTSGTGTFKPGKNARPFAGKKNTLSEVSEVKLEMECDPRDLNKILDSLLISHPYEETAYEIYDFKKRDKKETGMILNLKSGISIKDLISRMNKKLDYDGEELDYKVKKIVISDEEADETILNSAKFTDCDCLIAINSKSNNSYKLYKII